MERITIFNIFFKFLILKFLVILIKMSSFSFCERFDIFEKDIAFANTREGLVRMQSSPLSTLNKTIHYKLKSIINDKTQNLNVKMRSLSIHNLYTSTYCVENIADYCVKLPLHTTFLEICSVLN